MKNTEEGGRKNVETDKEHHGQKAHEQAGLKGGHAQSHEQSQGKTTERGQGKDDDEDDSPAARPRESVGYTQGGENQEEKRTFEVSPAREHSGNQHSQGSDRSAQGGGQSHGSSRSQNSGRSQNDGRSQNGNHGSKDK